MTIALDTPDQIAAWVLLSRRSQLKLQMKGLKTPGLVKWIRENVPGAENARTAKACVLPVETACANAGIEPDWSQVRAQAMRHMGRGVYLDLGVFENFDAMPEEWFKMAQDGSIVVQLTTDEVRERNGELYSA